MNPGSPGGQARDRDAHVGPDAELPVAGRSAVLALMIPAMRIKLVTPFAKKHAVKTLGARCDTASRKSRGC